MILLCCFYWFISTSKDFHLIVRHLPLTLLPYNSPKHWFMIKIIWIVKLGLLWLSQNLTEGELTYLHVIDMSLLSGAIYKKGGEQLRSFFTMEHNRNLQRFVFFTNLSNKCICSFLFYLNHSFGLLMFSVSCWSIVEYMLHWCLLRGFMIGWQTKSRTIKKLPV